MPVPDPQLLPHEFNPDGYDPEKCVHCKAHELDVTSKDCPKRRLLAMAEAVGQGTAGTHVQAVERWHRR